MKAILFDFGGTIDTDGVHWSEKYWDVYQQFGVGVSKKAYEAAFVESEAMLLQYTDLPRATFQKTIHKQLIFQFGILKLDDDAAVVKEMADACYEDVRKTIAKASVDLTALQERYRLGVVSNFYGNLEVVCKEFGLDKFFNVMIDSAVVGVRKPDPEIFAKALRKMDILAREACVVGDSYERDVVPGKSLGCKTIWLKGKSWMIPSSTAAADHTIDKFEEIKKLLL